MDSTVKRLLGALGLALPLLAGAQQLQDPTRVPAGLGEGSAQAGEMEGAPAAPRLQSILIGAAPNNRRLAVIDGVTVTQGGKFADAVVERINDNSVVLRRGKLRETLILFPQTPGGLQVSGNKR
ncbi:MSHA biogenesis protein MshK [Pseudoduganella sp. FT93W]|uniref:MSHA biogenesis protein MshK n=1 Tax=Duganella fentianensis TaxID=2692177 RepID=A0A845I1S8_9BURK|nr:MSHA biogenesis protein MshK [Duganella fentianensis]MYN47500.1 MSHA biogenesis protein MshK [Duganella fentianensis]